MLDINSERGRETREQESEATDIFHRHHPQWHYIKTDPEERARIDAVIIEWGGGPKLASVAETKCRKMTMEQFVGFDMRWLVTAEKLKKCAEIAEALWVPLWGFLYLVPDKTLLCRTLFDASRGGWQVEMEIRRTETQATVNGGIANRENAFIDMRKATVFK